MFLIILMYHLLDFIFFCRRLSLDLLMVYWKQNTETPFKRRHIDRVHCMFKASIIHLNMNSNLHFCIHQFCFLGFLLSTKQNTNLSHFFLSLNNLKPNFWFLVNHILFRFYQDFSYGNLFGINMIQYKI